MAKNEETKDVGFLQEYAGQGFEGIGAQDFAIPFIRILQALNPQINEDDPAYIKGAKVGMFFNTVTGRLYGQTIRLIPIMYAKHWLEWMPNRGGLVGRHEPESIPVDKENFSKWKRSNGNIVSEHHMFYVLVADHLEDGPAVFSLTSSGIKHAKNWNTQIMMTRLPDGQRAPYFSSVWELQTVKCENKQGQWYQIGDKKTMITRIRFVDHGEFSKAILPARDLLATNRIDYAGAEDTAEPAEEGKEGAAKAPY